MSLPYDDATAARLKGDLLVKSGGSWRYADRVWVKSSGTWRSSENVYVKSGGTWRDAAQYDVYRFEFTLNDNNNGSGNAGYNFKVQEKKSFGNNTVTGSANQASSTFVLSSRLTAISSWSNNIAYGAIYVNSTQRYLRIDSLPAGSRVVLYINSGKRILGGGGKGGNGSSNNNAGGNGVNGQTALYCRTDTILVNNGQIGGGGGGGGGGRGGQCVYQNTGQKACMKGNQCPVTYQNFSQEQGGGGGGGAGYPGGAGGLGSPQGQFGQSNAKGNGGGNQSCNAQDGRNGGNLGQAGQTKAGTAGSSGSGGAAIDGVNYITKEVSGTINGAQNNG
tara:strand:+ start:854 stop:1852 length:999 start_codon:yes stop_codon:yes gene_type:complete